jgi:hypothetical protein
MEEPANNDVVSNDEAQQPPVVDNEQNNKPLRRSQRNRKSTISNDYMAYMYGHINDIENYNNPTSTSYKEAMKRKHSFMWLDVMNDEIKYMSTNDV